MGAVRRLSRNRLGCVMECAFYIAPYRHHFGDGLGPAWAGILGRKLGAGLQGECFVGPPGDLAHPATSKYLDASCDLLATGDSARSGPINEPGKVEGIKKWEQTRDQLSPLPSMTPAVGHYWALVSEH
jgi:hypothetical protein